MAIINVRDNFVSTSSQDEVSTLNQTIINQTVTDLNDTQISNKQTNQVLTWNGSFWVNAAPQSTVNVLDDLTDVVITTPATDQVLKYNGTTWVNDTSPAGASDLNGLTDVTITTPTTGQVLKYNGTTWINDVDAGSGLLNVVEDTTPQLGGDLDVNGNALTNPNGHVEFLHDPTAGTPRKIKITSESAGNPGDIFLYTYGASGFIPSAMTIGTGAEYDMMRIIAWSALDDGTHRVDLDFHGDGGAIINAKTTNGGGKTNLTFDASSFTFNNGGATFNNATATFNNGVDIVGSNLDVDGIIRTPNIRQRTGAPQLGFEDANGNTMASMKDSAIVAGGGFYNGEINFRTNASLAAGAFGIQFETLGNDKGIFFQGHGDINIQGQSGGSDPTHGVTLWGHGNLGMTIDRDMMYTGKPFQFCQIPVGTTAPVSPLEGDFWLDTTTTPVLKTYRGAAWITIHQEKEGLAFYDSTNHRIVIRSNGAWVAMAAFVAL